MPRLITTCIIMLLLFGCESPGRVIGELPPPPVYVRPRVAEHVPARQVRPPISRSIAGKVIVVDPGHGGKDPGAPGKDGQDEKHLALSIGMEIARQLEAQGARVIATRASDRFITLDRRAEIAESSRADLFISIHADSARNRAAQGVGVHIYNKASLNSQQAAYRIVSAVRRAGLESRGIYRNNFHVLREHSRPAILIECGFLSNSEDRRNLNNPAYRTRLASAIVEGVVDHLGE